MPLPIRFHPEALLELKDGARFYGERFVAQVDDALALITEMPDTWPMWRGRTDLRRRVLKKVPYAIVYAVDRAISSSQWSTRSGAQVTGLAGFEL